MKRICGLIAVLWVMFALLPSLGSAQSEKQGIAIYNQARALRDVPRSREDLETALAKYRRALEIFEKVGSSWQGAALNDIGLIYSKLSQYKTALEYFKKALDIHRRFGNPRGEATTLNNIGVSYVELGQYSEAMEYYEKALVMSKRSRNLQAEGWTLGGIGVVQRQSGQYQKALEYYEKAIEVERKLRNVKEEAEDVFYVGQIFADLGQYQKALEYYERALVLEEKSGNVRAEGWTFSGMGSIYDDLGQYQKALVYHQKALDIDRKEGNVRSQGFALNDIGKTYVRMEKYEDTLASFQKAIAIQAKIGVPTRGSEELIGNLYLDMGKLDKAEPYVRAANYSRSLGRLYLLKSDYAAAKKNYESCLAWAEKNKDADELFTAYTGLGRVYEGLEDYKKAEGYYEKGMKLTEEIRSSLLPAERKNFFEVKINGFQRSEPAKGLTHVRMKLNQAAGSIDSSEATRARAFSDNIALTTKEGTSGVPHQVLQKENEIVSKVAALKKQLAKTDKEKSPATYGNINQQVQGAEAELNTFVQMLWEKYKPYASVKYPRPVTLKESALKPEEYVVIFDVSSEGVGVKLIKGKKIAQNLLHRVEIRGLGERCKKVSALVRGNEAQGIRSRVGPESVQKASRGRADAGSRRHSSCYHSRRYISHPPV